MEYIKPDKYNDFKSLRGIYSINAERSGEYYKVYLFQTFSGSPTPSTAYDHKMIQLGFYVPTTSSEVGINLYEYLQTDGGTETLKVKAIFNASTGLSKIGGGTMYNYFYIESGSQTVAMEITPEYDTFLWLTIVFVGDKVYGYYKTTKMSNEYGGGGASEGQDYCTLSGDIQYNNYYAASATNGYIEDYAIWQDYILNPIHRPYRRSGIIDYQYNKYPAIVYAMKPADGVWTAITNISSLTIDREIRSSAKATITLDTPAYYNSGAIEVGDIVRIDIYDIGATTEFMGIVPPEGVSITGDKTTVTAYDYIMLLNNSYMWRPDFNGTTVSDAIERIISCALVDGKIVHAENPTTPDPTLDTALTLDTAITPTNATARHSEYDGWVSRGELIKEIVSNIPIDDGIYGYDIKVIDDTPTFRLYELDNGSSAVFIATDDNVLSMRAKSITEFVNAVYVRDKHIYYKNLNSVNKIGEYSKVIDSIGTDEEDANNASKYVNYSMQRPKEITISRPDLYNISLGDVISISNSTIAEDGNYIVTEMTIQRGSVDRCEITATLPIAFYFK